MTRKVIYLNSCRECHLRTNASVHGWRNIYCDTNGVSVTEEDDQKGFPTWCSLSDEVV